MTYNAHITKLILPVSGGAVNSDMSHQSRTYGLITRPGDIPGYHPGRLLSTLIAGPSSALALSSINPGLRRP